MNPKKTWIKKLKKTQKQPNEIKEDVKLWNETKEIIFKKR
jgi:hypothetical protein